MIALLLQAARSLGEAVRPFVEALTFALMIALALVLTEAGGVVAWLCGRMPGGAS